jgi:hypothetical protein
MAWPADLVPHRARTTGSTFHLLDGFLTDDAVFGLLAVEASTYNRAEGLGFASTAGSEAALPRPI